MPGQSRSAGRMRQQHFQQFAIRLVRTGDRRETFCHLRLLERRGNGLAQRLAKRYPCCRTQLIASRQTGNDLR